MNWAMKIVTDERLLYRQRVIVQHFSLRNAELERDPIRLHLGVWILNGDKNAEAAHHARS
jgi:hypothetical protein